LQRLRFARASVADAKMVLEVRAFAAGEPAVAQRFDLE
jgi:hypothetical protein